MKANFLVTLTLPTGVPIQRMRVHIEECIKIKKVSSTDDPLYNLDKNKIRVQMLGVKQ